MTTIYQHYTFDAAHFLPSVPDDHKCRRLHGHTYHVTVYVKGMLKSSEQWVMDFGELKAIVKPVLDLLDHQLLNDIEGLSNPTAEVLANWLWKRLKPDISRLTRLEIKETPNTGVIYEG